MMWRSSPDATVLAAVRDRLENLSVVERALVDEAQTSVCLICHQAADLAGVSESARSVLAAEGIDPDSYRIEVAVRPDAGLGGRVRFDGIDVVAEPERMVRVRVSLDWDGRRVTGEAVGERGETIELRTAVTAAITALEELTDNALGVRLAGVKQIRAFDAELMVVSLYRPGLPGQKLLGAVLMGPDPHRSAALALLNALNRILGNYLATR